MGHLPRARKSSIFTITVPRCTIRLAASTRTRRAAGGVNMRYGAMVGLAAGLLVAIDADEQLLRAAAPMVGEALDTGAASGPVPGVLRRGPIANQLTGA